MNKKIISSLCIASLLLTTSVYAAANISVKVTDVQYKKDVKNGMLVLAKAIFPRDVTTDQIKPATIYIFKELKKAYPKCEWFTVWMADDERMYNSGNYIAIAEYKEGDTSVHGGIPTEKEMAEFRNRGKSETGISKKARKRHTIMKPTDQGMDIFLEFTNIKQTAHKSGKYLSDGQIYPLLSHKFGIPIAKIEEIHCGIGWYYMMLSHNEL